MKLPTTKIMLVIFLAALLIVGYGSGSLADNLGLWTGLLDDSNQSDDYPIQISRDGDVTMAIAVAEELKSQYTSFQIRDSLGGVISNTYLTETSKTVTVQLAPGDFTIWISKGRNDIWGTYSISGNLTPASPSSTESENNDTYDTADPITGYAFYGSLGYREFASGCDDIDYFKYVMSAGGELTLTAETFNKLASYNTYLTIYNSDNEFIKNKILSQTSNTLNVDLDPATYYISLHIGLCPPVIYGAYEVNITSSGITTTVESTTTTTTEPTASTTTSTVPDVSTTTTTTSPTTSTTTTPSICPADNIPCGDECCSNVQKCCGNHCCSLSQGCCGDTCCDRLDFEECCYGTTCCVEGESCSYFFGCVDDDDIRRCLSVPLYGEDSEEVELLKNFRDEVLSQSPVGQEIIELYYQWSPVIEMVMEEDEEFREGVEEMMDKILLLLGGEE